MTSIGIDIRREAVKENDRIEIDVSNHEYGLAYQIRIDTRDCQVRMLKDRPGTRIMPQKSPLERRHSQEARASAMYSVHGWCQFFMEQYDGVMAYMRGDPVSGENPFDVNNVVSLENRDHEAFLAATWVSINPKLRGRITGARMTFLERIKIYAKSYRLAESATGMDKGYIVGKPQQRLIKAYCDALRLTPGELAEWLKSGDDAAPLPLQRTS